MSYSFFGTCFNDHKQFFGCLETILNQTILPEEIILVDSGELDIEQEILEIISPKKIKLIYIRKKLSRVKSLNIAIDKSNSKYSFRFDTRSRFDNDYAENALSFLEDKKLSVAVVGGVPSVKSISSGFEPRLCSEIMKSSYLYFFPKHRNTNYSGYSSSIYLGCFFTSILKNIRFNEKKALISEDSLIINDFLEKDFKAYVSSNIKVSYVCRTSFINILKLFYSYGYCRANTIILSKKFFISKRHFYVFLILVINSLILVKVSFLYIFSLPLIILIFNLFCEIFFYRKRINFFVPICGTLCQFSWILGFFWNLISTFKVNKSFTNFVS